MRFARIDSRESFATETPISIACQADSHEALEFPIRANHPIGEHPGDHNHQDFPRSIAIQMGGVLRCKWEAYCDTNGRRTAVQMGGVLNYVPFLRAQWHRKRIAIQIGGVLQYFFEK